MISRWFPFILLVLGVTLAVLTFLEPNGFPRVERLRGALLSQREDTARLRREVRALKREVIALQGDPRKLEKTVREELGMARPNEEIYFFDE